MQWKSSTYFVLKSKPIKRGWTLWCTVDHTTGAYFNVFIDDDSLCAETANHLAWGMTDVKPYLHCHWAMDNWFTSKLLYDEMVQIGQYLHGTMEVR
eukprot:11632691-Ditylum_brightwellii.AAC.1